MILSVGLLKASNKAAKILEGIQQTYAQYFHARHGTCGSFWQNRYNSKPVEVGPYLARCGRYIERNPVRAEIIDAAEDYRWAPVTF